MLLTVFIVAVLAIVQSLFGVGLLVFGTPTLLLLGYSFADTLAILLPASITISLLQVWKSGRQDTAFVRSFSVFCLVPLTATLAAVLLFDLHASLNLVVAILLAVFVILRLSPQLNRRTSGWVTRHQKIWLVLMGVVHGFSNLGGALLLIFAASRFQRKEDIRALVAFCYACFAASQLVVLAVFTPRAFGWEQLGYGALPASSSCWLASVYFDGFRRLHLIGS